MRDKQSRTKPLPRQPVKAGDAAIHEAVLILRRAGNAVYRDPDGHKFNGKVVTTRQLLTIARGVQSRSGSPDIF